MSVLEMPPCGVLGAAAAMRQAAVDLLSYDLSALSGREAVQLLEKSDRRVKLALSMYWTGLTATEGEKCLEIAQGNLRQAVQNWKNV